MRRGPGGRAACGVAPPAPTPSFGLLIRLDLKTPEKKSRRNPPERRHIAKLRRGSQKSRGTPPDELEEIIAAITAITANASPSTSNVSPSMWNNSKEKHAYEVTTRGGVSTQDPLYPEGHPKRIEQDSQRIEPSAHSRKKKKKKHKNVVESSEPANDPNSISISDAETESGNEHDNDKDNDKNDTPDKEEAEEEPEKHAKNKKYTKEDFIAEKHDKLIPTDISLQMADKSTAIPVGICENVPVQVTTTCLILTDFVVLEMPEDDNMSIILGRPFLNTAGLLLIAIKEREAMKKFSFGELFKKGTTSTGRPSRAATRIRQSYNEDILAPSFAPEEDHGPPNASTFPCYDFLRNAGILEDFLTLVNRAGLTTYMSDEREQYHMLTKIFVESFQFDNKQYEPTVAFRIYGKTVTMPLKDFCCALDIAPVGTASRIDDNPRDLLELYRGITDDDCRTIQRGKIRNIQLPAIKYFAYYIATSILGRRTLVISLVTILLSCILHLLVKPPITSVLLLLAA
ncbi:hypothetical protein QYE76_069826 [Lolium multiflorum]|uniref:Arabidopsis retrotransposon Orf1 C-terminal domain-containing protein n=1 Tax=Lolium multiflorum TaxID=4521 RepID=A0AAD8WD24_LOLMU|nr:hypothetical protein QYE76_069826 [Lolium multiflorum]